MISGALIQGSCSAAMTSEDSCLTAAAVASIFSDEDAIVELDAIPLLRSISICAASCTRPLHSSVEEN